MNLSYDFEKLNTENQSPFFDTGTTFVYLKSDLFDELRYVFHQFCSAREGNCGRHLQYKDCFYFNTSFYDSYQDFVSSFPDILFDIGDQEPFVWTPHDYFTPHINDPDYSCVSLKPFHANIFGSMFFKNKDIYFDRKLQIIQFTKANCPVFIDKIFSYKNLLFTYFELLKSLIIYHIKFVLSTPFSAFAKTFGLAAVVGVYGVAISLCLCVYW